jgi:hypothetical protein
LPKGSLGQGGTRMDNDSDGGRNVPPASHERLELGRSNSQIAIDDEQWIIGFVRGAPMRIEKT